MAIFTRYFNQIYNRKNLNLSRMFTIRQHLYDFSKVNKIKQRLHIDQCWASPFRMLLGL